MILPRASAASSPAATLAIARAAGETAPLLFTCALTTSQVSWDPREPLQSIPLTIFQDLENPDPALHEQAWAAALVLMAFVLVVSVLSKAALARSRRKLRADDEGGYDRHRGSDRSRAASRDADDANARRSSTFAASRCSTAARSRSADVNLEIYRNMVTALIGPSGCGKSTFIRCLNRMNDLIAGARIEGEILYHGQDIYGSGVDPVVGAPLDRDGVPEAEPVPEVDLRQRRLGAAHARHAQGARRARRARARRRPRSGTR